MRFRNTSLHCLRRCCKHSRIRRRASQRTVRHRSRPSPLRVGLLNMLPSALCVGECGPIRRCHRTKRPAKHVTAVYVCRCVSHLWGDRLFFTLTGSDPPAHALQAVPNIIRNAVVLRRYTRKPVAIAFTSPHVLSTHRSLAHLGSNSSW